MAFESRIQRGEWTREGHEEAERPIAGAVELEKRRQIAVLHELEPVLDRESVHGPWV